ncbi:MAG: hypothetical protein KGZ31_02560 [Sulfuritalea sp.]|nr:hypothetical protein [Sulfuritalea sp.]
MRTFAIILSLFLLGACGTKTSLVLPPKPAPAGSAATKPATPAAENSTPDAKTGTSTPDAAR